MMYLSRYELTHRDCLRHKVTDTYSLHRIALNLFPREAGPAGRLLYADKGFVKGCLRILILSGRKPEAPEFGLLETRPIPDAFFNYGVYGFEVIVNPVRRSNATGARWPLRQRAEIKAWFEKRAQGWGFAAEHVEVDEIRVDQFKKGNALVTLGKAKLTGALEVTDMEKFKTAFMNGLGSGKAFGCGLLQLAPLA